MSEKIRKKTVTIIFAGAIIWAFFNFIPGSTNKFENKTASLETRQALTDDTNIKTDVIDIELKSKESWGRDPFIYHGREVTSSPAPTGKHKLWKLSGIIHNNSSPVAIINMHPVKIGDLVDDARVIDINKKDVVLDYNGTRIVLNISKG